MPPTSVSQKLPQDHLGLIQSWIKVSPILHVALQTVSSMSEVLIRVAVMPFSRKGLDDLRCEIPRFTEICFSLLYWLNPENACEPWSFSFREGKVEILTIPTELEGERECRTWEQPDIEVTKASLSLAIGPFAV